MYLILNTIENSEIKLLSAIMQSNNISPVRFEYALKSSGSKSFFNHSQYPGSAIFGVIGEAVAAAKLKKGDITISSVGITSNNILNEIPKSMTFFQPSMENQHETSPIVSLILNALSDSETLFSEASSNFFDILHIVPGGTFDIHNTTINIEPLLGNSFSSNNKYSASNISFGAKHMISFKEVTLSNQYSNMIIRAIKVDAFAKIVKHLPTTKSVSINSTLVLDQEAFYQLESEQQKSIIDIATQNGGFVQLLSGLRDATMEIRNSIYDAYHRH